MTEAQAPYKGQTIAYCSLAILIALYIVGAVSHGSLRHVVQTLPLWFPIVTGFRRHSLAKWSALPCFVFWLLMMSLIWFYLLGWAHVLSGHFSTIEIAMTFVVGLASASGISTGLNWRTMTSPATAWGISTVFLVLQVLFIRLSFIPSIAHR